jgi:hypothetical protein
LGYNYVGDNLKVVGQKNDPIRCKW